MCFSGIQGEARQRIFLPARSGPFILAAHVVLAVSRSGVQSHRRFLEDPIRLDLEDRWGSTPVRKHGGPPLRDLYQIEEMLALSAAFGENLHTSQSPFRSRKKIGASSFGRGSSCILSSVSFSVWG